MRAMFYKKMIHTAPNVWPIIMIITSFILIAIIARLSVMLNVPKERMNEIKLAYDDERVESIDNIPNLGECGYINIQSVSKNMNRLMESHSKVFDKDSLVCEKGNYRDDLKKKAGLTSIGAVEADGEQNINGYISQDIFHSAPVMLNLLHNIILK